MTEGITVLDAGPCINFCAASKQKLLSEIIASASFNLHAPDIVSDEITSIEKKDSRFRGTASNWNKMVEHGHASILSSELDSTYGKQLGLAVQRISQMSLSERRKTKKDLGEVMVVAHGIVLQDMGHSVLVVIDDGYGQSLASRNDLTVMTTIDILKLGVRTGHIKDKGQMRKLYAQLKSFDDGLVDIVQTDLLHKKTWNEADLLPDTTVVEPVPLAHIGVADGDSYALEETG